jgi:hypothetical protein
LFREDCRVKRGIWQPFNNVRYQTHDPKAKKPIRSPDRRERDIRDAADRLWRLLIDLDLDQKNAVIDKLGVLLAMEPRRISDFSDGPLPDHDHRAPFPVWTASPMPCLRWRLGQRLLSPPTRSRPPARATMRLRRWNIVINAAAG